MSDWSLIFLASVVVASVYPFLWVFLVYKPRAKHYGCSAPYIDFAWPFGFFGLVRVVRGFRKHDLLQYFYHVFVDNGIKTGFQQMAGQMWLGTIEPENIKTILATSFGDYSLGFRYDLMYTLLGDGIFTQSGAEWKHSRALLRPQFSREQVSRLKLISGHVNLLLCHFSSGKVIDAQELYHRFTIDSATDFLFGESTHTLVPDLAEKNFVGPRGSVTGSQFATAFTSALEILSFRVAAGAAWFLVWTPQFWSNCQICHNFIDYFVVKTLESPDVKDAASDQYVFIRELAKDTQDPKAIRDQAFNILLAGRDTTASLLSFTTFYLAKFPELFNELRDVVLTEFGYDDDSATFEKLKKCKLLQYVIKEVLRLHPVVPMNFRTAIRHTKLPKGGGISGEEPVLVMKGQNVFYSTYAMQRNPAVWGPDAHQFRPQRWFDRAGSGWEYLPFNGGPRICLGQQFALTETSYTIVRICQEFTRIELVHPNTSIDTRLAEKIRLTTSMAGGIIVKFHK